jgi:hypothetical protein
VFDASEFLVCESKDNFTLENDRYLYMGIAEGNETHGGNNISLEVEVKFYSGVGCSF